MFTDATGQFFGSTNDPVQQLQQSSSIATLAQVSSNAQLSKTDSHAVLMELFARDQDLVRQATESARLKAEAKQQQQQLQQEQSAGGQASQQQQPVPQQSSAPTSQHPMMKAPASSALQGVPSLNSWPHFSSITSLNNLGTIPGVKSITSLSGADLASKGNLNKMGNIAQVKSMESLGKNDSYAFLEVFFGDRSSTNLIGMGGGVGGTNKGTLMGKQYGDEDNEIGLSLEDESPSHVVKKEFHASTSMSQNMAFGAPSAVMSGTGDHGAAPDAQTSGMGSDALKRAYDDALAARGLMSVSRSCENLTDLVLPAKIQRTLSREFINSQQEQEVRKQMQQLAQQQKEQDQGSTACNHPSAQQASEDDVGGEAQVQVASTAVCASCSETNIDTQLRPCGHMFHERCLKPSLSNIDGPPKCPIDGIPIHSAVLAIPDPDPVRNSTEQRQSDWPSNNEALEL
jgi:Zinc finger, C3HC4 type (RING finger)